ncbi:MAG TPA: hypothetical protein VF599_01090 [Pyrinomonadaceae bacterium]|jgi:hypothetical protein
MYVYIVVAGDAESAGKLIEKLARPAVSGNLPGNDALIEFDRLLTVWARGLL